MNNKEIEEMEKQLENLRLLNNFKFGNNIYGQMTIHTSDKLGDVIKLGNDFADQEFINQLNQATEKIILLKAVEVREKIKAIRLKGEKEDETL